MASWQAYASAWLLKRRLKPRLRAARDILELRRLLVPPAQKQPADVVINAAAPGGVPGEWVRPREQDKGRLKLLYLHGGGYIACSAETHRPVTCFFGQLGFDVFAPNYRLAPEHVFPAAVEDAVAAYRAISEGEDCPVLMAGDSAGGGLAVAAMLMLRDTGWSRMPAGAVLFSPWADLAATGESLKTNNKKCALFDGAKLGPTARHYLAEADPKTPLASPMYADLSALPPMLIHAAANETLLDDSRRLAARASEAGVDVTLKIWPVVPHCWQLMPEFVPEARRSLREAGAFLRAAASKAGAVVDAS